MTKVGDVITLPGHVFANPLTLNCSPTAKVVADRYSPGLRDAGRLVAVVKNFRIVGRVVHVISCPR